MVVKKKNMFSDFAKKRLKTFFVILAIAVLMFNVFSTFLVGIASAQENGGQNCDTSKYTFDNGAKYIVNCSLGRFTQSARVGSDTTLFKSDSQPYKYDITIVDHSTLTGSKKNGTLNEYEVVNYAATTCPNPPLASGPVCQASPAHTERKSNTPKNTTNITISKDVADDNAADLPVYQYDNELVNGKNVKKNVVVNPDHTLVLRLDGGEYKADTTTAVQSGSKYTVKVSDSDDNRGTLTTITCTVGASNGSGYGKGETTCSDPHTEDIIIKDDNGSKTPLDITAAASGSGSNQENQTLTDQCYSALPSLGWILCGVIDIADSLYSVVRSWVYKLLYIPESNYNSADCTEGCLKDTWNVSKNLANVGIVLVALIMIASQIFSFEFMSAYTIKKVIPRLIAAAILIQLSWFIFGAMIQITNALGFGIYSLLTNAFGATDIMGFLGSDTVMEGVTKQAAGGAIIIGSIIGGAALVGTAMSPGGMLAIVFAMLGVIIALAVAVVTLLVRKMLIIILLAIAPLALLAWILPGTQNLWNTWWKLFSRLLAMMPLIALLFAAGTIGAKVILTSDGDQLFSLIGGIIVFFAPLFLITATFKFAGGMFNSVQNVIGKASGKTKEFGWGGVKARNKETRQEEKRRKGQQLADTNADLSKAHGARKAWMGIQRTRGRLAAGTLGASGAYAQSLRLQERSSTNEAADKALSFALSDEDAGDARDNNKEILDAYARGDSTAKLKSGKVIKLNDEMFNAVAKQAMKFKHRDRVAIALNAGNDARRASFDRYVNAPENTQIFDDGFTDAVRLPHKTRNSDGSVTFTPYAVKPDQIVSAVQKQVADDRAKGGSGRSSYLEAGIKSLESQGEQARRGIVTAAIQLDDKSASAQYIAKILEYNNVADAKVLAKQTGLSEAQIAAVATSGKSLRIAHNGTTYRVVHSTSGEDMTDKVGGAAPPTTPAASGPGGAATPPPVSGSSAPGSVSPGGIIIPPSRGTRP